MALGVFQASQINASGIEVKSTTKWNTNLQVFTRILCRDNNKNGEIGDRDLKVVAARQNVL